VAGEFLWAVVEQARALNLLSDEHFTVVGTLVEAWASLKSFKRLVAARATPSPRERAEGSVSMDQGCDFPADSGSGLRHCNRQRRLAFG
jgi:hypothetical protein